MIVVLKPGAPQGVVDALVDQLRGWNLETQTIVGRENVVIGLIGDTSSLCDDRVQELSPFIDRVLRVKKRFKRASREFHPERTVVSVPTAGGTVEIGGEGPLVCMAGPCSVESEAMILETAHRVKAAGARILRGGAYKPRTSPYDFQGHGESALELLAAARTATGLAIVTEVMDTSDLEAIAEVADIVQVGARNMQNYSLLKKVGQQPKPVLLKRAFSATIDEWLLAAEYILAAGNPNVILCERGIRTFDRQYTRNTLDLAAVPVLRSITHLPVIVDPSHGTGLSQFVESCSKAAVAIGADGLMIEVHPDPARALSDGPQCLTPDEFDAAMANLAPIALAVGRPLQTAAPAAARP
ncbi:3-deoxy-7-phosphoheptulonate synthase [Gloeobacter violaceus]|uniref:Carboxysome formation protein n=1 Tax=Gloeobacter violaceus (strain ATCC 29082 / PCC 7421) TaxID=251221 RepID=Q7NJU1_GLOVI|nr:carboxysome formation protein [Gloeobacter violaceus PCC 7421]